MQIFNIYIYYFAKIQNLIDNLVEHLDQTTL